MVGEFDCAGKQVDEDPAEAGDVADDGVRTCGIKLGAESAFPFGGAGGEEADGGGYAVPQGKQGFLDPELPGFDLGEVEDVVDDGEEMLAAGLDSLDAFALFGGEGSVTEQRGHADDGVHRGANLVTHGCEKLRLGPGGPFRGAAGGIEETTSFLEIGNDAGLVFDDPTKFDEVDNLAAEAARDLSWSEVSSGALDR